MADDVEVLLEHRTQPAWIVVPESLHILAVNAAACRSFGHTREQFLRISLSDLAGADRSRVRASAGEDRSLQLSRPRFLRHKSGWLLETRCTVQPIVFRGLPACLVVAETCRSVGFPESVGGAPQRLVYNLLGGMIRRSLDAVVVVDRAWQIIYVNACAGAYLRRPIPALVGRPLSDVLAPQAVDALRSLAASASNAGAAQAGEIYCADPELWFEAQLYPSAEGIVLSLRDIAERLRQQQQLQLNVERFERVAAATRDAVWDFDLRADLVWWNDAYQQKFGHVRGGRGSGLASWRRLIHAEDRDGVVERFHQFLDSGDRHWSAQYRYRRADGSYVEVQDRGVLMRGEDGAPLRMVGILSDLSAVQASERDSKLFAAIVSATRNGIIVADAQTHAIVYANEAFERLSGYRAGELVGRSAALLYGGEARPDVEALRAAVLAGRSEQLRVRYRNKQGRELWLNLQCSPLFDGVGRVTHFLDVLADATQQQEREDDLRRHATHDSLTGLPNRLLFLDRVSEAVKRRPREGAQVGVLLIDLDDFKLINDAIGVRAGDFVLRSFADRISRLLDVGESLARVGGDEFAILSSGADVATRLVTLTEAARHVAQQPIQVMSRAVGLTTTTGSAIHAPSSRYGDDLIRAAEMALFEASRKGRNVSVMFTPELAEEYPRRLDMMSRLRRAVGSQAFRLHYQPQVDLRARRTIGFEALVRWTDEELGEVPPSQFLAMAESAGLSRIIDAWVLGEACRQAQQWRAEGVFRGPIAVNVSPKLFHEHSVLDMVSRALELHQLPPEAIEIEITEGTLMEDAESTREQLLQLSRRGIGIGIDDFGTGYSSLSYLTRLPISKLKIDRAFVEKLAGSVSDRAVTEAVISIGRSLNLQVIAEGVETIEQARILSAMGCDLVQGWLVAVAMPQAEVRDFLLAPLQTPAR